MNDTRWPWMVPAFKYTIGTLACGQTSRRPFPTHEVGCTKGYGTKQQKPLYALGTGLGTDISQIWSHESCGWSWRNRKTSKWWR